VERRQGGNGRAGHRAWIGQVIIGDAIPAANAAPDTASGNNGWGNGGDDGTNKGSDEGGGVSQGGNGAGSPQSKSKTDDAEQDGR